MTKWVDRLAPAVCLLGVTLSLTLNVSRWRAESKTAASTSDDYQDVKGSLPRVSVLVAAWNESAIIEDHLQSFLRLRYPDIELIICAGGTDGTFQQALDYQSDRIRVIEQLPGEGKQRALARCFEHATGDLIYLTDADCLYCDSAICRLISPIILEGESAASGTSRPLESQSNSLLARHIWARDLAAARSKGDYTQGILGRNAVVSRNAIEAIGGLDFHAPTGTDYQLARRLMAAGVRIRHVPESSVASRYPVSLGEYRHKQSRWLRNLILFGPKFRARDDVVATMKTMALGSIMLTLPVAGLLVGRGFWFLWTVLLAHASFTRLRQMSEASRQTRRPFPVRYSLLVAGLAMIDFAVAALPLVDLLSERKRTSW